MGAESATIDQLLEQLLTPQLGHACRRWPGSLRRLLHRFALEDRSNEETVLLRMIADRPRDRLALLVAAATVPHTSFFRHPEQFEHLAKLFQKVAAQGRRPVRVWSAGCATGEEPYTLAMCAESAKVDVDIFATDVSPECIRSARLGHYSPTRSAGLRNRDAKKGWTAPDAYRRRIRFEVSSLMGPDPAMGNGPFDVILCRNVLVYFERDVAKTILAKLARFLRPHGTLVIAPAEIVALLPDTLTRVEPSGFLEARVPTAAATRGRSRPPRAIASKPEEKRADRLERAAELLGSGKPEASEAELHTLLATTPEDPLVWFLLGEALSARGEKAQARVAFQRAADYAKSDVTGIEAETLARAARRRAQRG